MATKEIKGAAIAPCWTSFIGAMAGAFCAVDKAECNLPKLAGVTGAAFRLNIHPELCPSGPTAVPAFEAVRRAFDQSGWDYEFFFGAPTDNTFTALQKRATAAIEKSVGREVPAIVWGVATGEFCLVTGYDSREQRFRVSTVMGEDADKSGLAYGELGLGPVPILEVVIPLEKVEADGMRVMREAVRFAVAHARGADARLPGYSNGLAAYGVWLESLKKGNASAAGMAYNVQVYAEARRFAKAYIADLAAADAFGMGEAFGKAAESYERVADNMTELAGAFPFRPGMAQDEKVAPEKAREAAGLVERALFWEADGVGRLEAILESIPD
jgi:hypothetical protein